MTAALDRRLSKMESAHGEPLRSWPDLKLEARMTELAEQGGYGGDLAEARADVTGEKLRALIAKVRESINARP